MSADVPASALYPYLAVALTLLATVAGRPAFPRKTRGFRAVMLYFASFFCLLFALPCLILLLFSGRPAEAFRAIGFSPGLAGRGLAVVAASLLPAFLAAVAGSADPLMRAFYPFSRAACAGRSKFALYGTAYIALYYLPWEFVYRGVLFFPILAATNLPTALALQTIISTLHHLGHPRTEIFAALGAGFVFGLVAYWTRSFFYGMLIHAFVGVVTDALICRRLRRSP
ncbi:MAG: CPBP family intramembrane metalloprotease [Candidatus Aminicenantes bacterium]|nr:CPBP family intramembrane metalloprotease [Candidatus Aminicenantes bacterium]